MKFEALFFSCYWQTYKPRKVHPRKRSIFITRQSSTSSSSGFGAAGNHSNFSSPSVKSPKNKELHSLKCMAKSGLLPGIPKSKRLRPGLSISLESEIRPKDLGGTSPVTSACVAAAMTANIPMAIAFTMRQISDETKKKETLNVSKASGINRSLSRESKKSFLSPKIIFNDTRAGSITSDLTIGQSFSSDSCAYSLPKPTWSDDQEIIAADNRNVDGIHACAIIHNSSVKRNVGQTNLNTRVTNTHSCQKSQRTSQISVNVSDISDVDHSAPSSPASSSHTSSISSLSDTSEGICIEYRQDQFLSQPLNHSAVDRSSSSSLGNKSKPCSNVVCGTYNTNFDKISLHYTPITKRRDNIVTVVEVHTHPDKEKS